ncbi:MAG: YncE family protein [Gammaproteobacteria bacterium]|nr:YncE family protein [Gammaproteobacteria bacterium]
MPQLLGSIALPTPPGSLSYLARVSQSLGSRSSPINGVSNPTYLAVAPNNKAVYVGGISRFVYVVNVEDPQNPTVSQAISISADPIDIYGMVLNPSGTMLYVAHENGISVINTATDEVERNISIDGANIDIAITPDGKTLYVTHGADSDNISIIDTGTFDVTPLAVGAVPLGVAISPDGTKAYVANYGDNTVSVIDTSNYSVESIPINNVGQSAIAGIAIAPDGSKAFVVTDIGVAIIDLSNNTVSYQTVASPNLIQFGNFVG